MFIGCRLFFVSADGPAGDLDLRGGDQSLLANGVWSMDCAFCASEGVFGLWRPY